MSKEIDELIQTLENQVKELEQARNTFIKHKIYVSVDDYNKRLDYINEMMSFSKGTSGNKG